MQINIESGHTFKCHKLKLLKKDIQPKLVSHFCEKSQFLKLSHGGCIFYEELSANEKDNSSKGYLWWKTVCTVVTNSSCHAHNFWQRNYLPKWSIFGRGEGGGGLTASLADL